MRGPPCTDGGSVDKPGSQFRPQGVTDCATRTILLGELGQELWVYRGYSWAIFAPLVLTLCARQVFRRGCVALLASMVVGPSAAPVLGDTPFCLPVPGCFSLFGVD